MLHISDRISNPFGMRPPSPNGCSLVHVVFGYGDINGDFHFIGDHPGVHGGSTTGVPFTESETGRYIQQLLYDVGLAADPYSDRPTLHNCFLSYLHMCFPSNGDVPSADEYHRLERYFDAELRAINAHILLPVGSAATDHVLREYTTQSAKLALDMTHLHARDIRGRGFLVVPIKEPTAWNEGDHRMITDTLTSILDSDYRQTKGVATIIG